MTCSFPSASAPLPARLLGTFREAACIWGKGATLGPCVAISTGNPLGFFGKRKAPHPNNAPSQSSGTWDTFSTFLVPCQVFTARDGADSALIYFIAFLHEVRTRADSLSTKNR